MLRRRFGATREQVTGGWRKPQIKQDYSPEDQNVKQSKAIKCNQYSVTKSFQSPFRKSADSVMTVFIYKM